MVNIFFKNEYSTIDVNLNSESIRMLPFANAIKTLEINTNQNTELGNYIFPIQTNISFPKEMNLKFGSQGKGVQLNSSTSAIINKNFYIPVHVLPPPDWKDHMNNFANWISPINFIWTFITAIGAVLIPFIISLYSKKSKETERNKNKQQYDSSNTLNGSAPIK